MERIINITYLFIISILPLLLGEEQPYPRCEWEKIEDCVTKISVYSIGNESFEVFQLSSENTKSNILYCDWIENGFECACSILDCSPPDNGTFHAFNSSTGKCLNVTNVQLSYGRINGIECTCTPKEYSNLSTNGRAGSGDRSNDIPNGESSTSPPIANKGSDEKPSSSAQSDNTKVWLPVIVTIAILIVAAAIVAVVWKRRRQRQNAGKESHKKEKDLALEKTRYHNVNNTDENYGHV